MPKPLLPDFLLDLYAEYGHTHPRPSGLFFLFNFIDESTTYFKALKRVQAICAAHGITPVSLIIRPGPEVKQPFNRSITLSVARHTLVPDRRHLP